MKIIEIKCPSCGGKLKVVDIHTGLITCEYCGSQFLLDDEKQQNITNYHIYQNSPSKSEKNTGLRVTAAVAAAIVGGILVTALNISKNSSPDSNPAGSFHMAYSGQGKESALEEAEAPASPFYETMVEHIFEKPSSDVTKEDLNRIKYLKIRPSRDLSQVWYSFDDPYSSMEPDIRQISFQDFSWDARDLTYFSGLVKLDLNSSLPNGLDLSSLTSLRGLVVTGTEFSELAAMVADPGQISELEIRNIDSTEGLSSFENLERLSIQDFPSADLKELVPLKSLKHLSLKDTRQSDSLVSSTNQEVRTTDYSAISVMAGLESLYIKSDLIKDISFLKGLENLSSLSLEDSSVISLEPLRQMTGLHELSLIDNTKIQDYQPVETLDGLTELTIDKTRSQPDLVLSKLARLKKLDISGFLDLASLKNMSSLTDLSIHGCNVDGAESILSTLTNVERLTLYSVWNSKGGLTSLDFLNGMVNLKYADFNGNLDHSDFIDFQHFIEVHGDISSVFNHPKLEELYLDEGRFEINFDSIHENQSLRTLSLRHLELHENYHVESFGGIVNMWYDDVALSDHLDFLSMFPNLENLYLDSNELTDLAFTVNLKNLSRLSIKDNYITDLSPLIHAEHLTYLNVSENPAGDLSSFGDGIEIVQ
ncbi:leucine-rich repeat domain-containing protein [Lachnospiraceae bacterium 62-35]